MNDEAVESKIERSLFRQTCNKCGKEVKGTSRKQLRHTFELHQFYCKKKKEEQITKENDTVQ